MPKHFFQTPLKLTLLLLACACMTGCFDDLVTASETQCTTVTNNATGEQSDCLNEDEVRAYQGEQLNNLIQDAIIEINELLTEEDIEASEGNGADFSAQEIRTLHDFRNFYSVPEHAIIIDVADLATSDLPTQFTFTDTLVTTQTYHTLPLYFVNFGRETVRFALRLKGEHNQSFEVNGPFTEEVTANQFHIAQIQFQPSLAGNKTSALELFFSNNQQATISLSGLAKGSCMEEGFRMAIQGISQTQACLWYGKHIAFALEDEHPTQRMDNNVTGMLNTLDRAFAALSKVTAYSPSADNLVNNRIVIEISEDLSETQLIYRTNKSGFAISKAFFNAQYDTYKAHHTRWHKHWFVGLAHNFLKSDITQSIDYILADGSNTTGWWRKALNEALVLFIADYQDVTIEADAITTDSLKVDYLNHVATYINAPNRYNWQNTFTQRILPWSTQSNEELDSLLVGIILQLYDSNRQSAFLSKLFAQLGGQSALNDLADYQTARDNTYLAMNASSNIDLKIYFETVLRWELSEGIE